MRDVYWREERAACLRLVVLGLFASTVVCRAAHLSRICTHALTFTPFPFNSVFLLVNLPANAVETCHCVSCFFPNTHSVFLSLSRTSWGLEVKSLCGKTCLYLWSHHLSTVAKERRHPETHLSRPEAESAVDWELDTLEPSFFPYTLSHHFYLSTSFLLFHLYPVKGKLVSISEMDRIRKQRRS